MVRNVVIFTFSTSGQISTVNDRRSSTVCLSIIIINTHSSPQYMLGGQRELHNKPRPGTKPSFTSSLSSLSTYSSLSSLSTYPIPKVKQEPEGRQWCHQCILAGRRWWRSGPGHWCILHRSTLHSCGLAQLDKALHARPCGGTLEQALLKSKAMKPNLRAQDPRPTHTVFPSRYLG